MKKLILILATSISLFSCSKKEEVKPQTTTNTTQTSTSTVTSNCNRDSTWTRTNPAVKNSLYTFYETCTTITITYNISKATVTVVKPTVQGAIISNWKNYSEYKNSPLANKFYYDIFYSTTFNRIIYEVYDAGTLGVGGPGMKMK